MRWRSFGGFEIRQLMVKNEERRFLKRVPEAQSNRWDHGVGWCWSGGHCSSGGLWGGGRNGERVRLRGEFSQRRERLAMVGRS